MGIIKIVKCLKILRRPDRPKLQKMKCTLMRTQTWSSCAIALPK